MRIDANCICILNVYLLHSIRQFMTNHLNTEVLSYSFRIEMILWFNMVILFFLYVMKHVFVSGTKIRPWVEISNRL
jgi:hypothetical protein